MRHGDEVSAVIESLNGARFVHDQLEPVGWDEEAIERWAELSQRSRCPGSGRRRRQSAFL
jgi:hypothetical protein